MNILETKNLTKIYHGTTVKALNDLTINVAEGEIFGYIGPNGAGKTTTIRLLLDLIRPTSGTAEIFGLNIIDKSIEIRKNIGYLPGEIFLPENLTGKECINYYAGFKNKIDNEYLKKLIKRFDVNSNKKVREYSKGNKQKIAIILALMHKPKLLILDEPTSGLDPLNQQAFYDSILETKKWGTTTFFCTHILEEAQRICDRVGILKAGKLLSIENVDEFKKKNIREIHLVTNSSIPLSELQKIEGIQKVNRTTTGYDLVTIGENGEVIKKLAKYNISDFQVHEPSLEEIFMHFYK